MCMYIHLCTHTHHIYTYIRKISYIDIGKKNMYIVLKGKANSVCYLLIFILQGGAGE